MSRFSSALHLEEQEDVMPTTRNRITQAMTGALAIVLLSTDVAWAEGRVDARARRARQAIEVLPADRDAPVEVTLSNGLTRIGRVEPLGDRSFLLVEGSGQRTQIPYGQVVRSQRPSKTTVALAAAGAAAVVMMICTNATGNPLCIPTGG
jgi:hypothetical protein